MKDNPYATLKIELRDHQNSLMELIAAEIDSRFNLLAKGDADAN